MIMLEGWCAERKQQLDRSIAATVTNGNLCTTRSLAKIFFRDWLLWFLQQIPSFRKELELGPRAGGMVRSKWIRGMPFLPHCAGGSCLPQVYCRSLSHSSNPIESQVQFTDDVIFRLDKQRLFQLVILVDDLNAAKRAQVDMEDLDLEAVSKGTISEQEASCIIHCPDVEGEDVSETLAPFHGRLYRVARAQEFASSGQLCNGGPAPIGYNMYRMRDDMAGRRYVIVRRDRFVFAACETVEDLVRACGAIEDTILAMHGR